MTGSVAEALAQHGQDFRAETGDVFPHYLLLGRLSLMTVVADVG